MIFLNSIFRETCNIPAFPKLEKDITTDVLIIGGGLCGVLCAYMLKRRGVECVLLEGDKLCAKTTGYTTAKITSQHALIYSKLTKLYGKEFARKYYEANTEAISEYRRLCSDVDCDWQDAASYVYTTDNVGHLTNELRAARDIGIDCRFVRNTELPFSIGGALCFDNMANFNPLKLVAKLAPLLDIYEDSSVRELVGTVALTDRYSVSAKRIVIATHFPIINKHGFYYLKMHQNRSYVTVLSGAERLRGMYIDEAQGGFSLRSYGEYLLLGGGAHRTGCCGDGWNKLIQFKDKYYPDAKEVMRYATQDCMTLDSVPYIGKYSVFSKNLYVATGFNKWGMTSSMVAARLLSDMLIGRENKYTKVFSPSRNIMHKTLAENTAEALRGLLSFRRRRCPHLGCALKWNKYEHTWDCPCHGSRFDREGNILDGPANRGIREQ